jgi:hypothetical protein
VADTVAMERMRKKELLYSHGGEFLRELAVLVMVFGNLDSMIQKEIRSPPAWVLGSCLVAGIAFALGHRFRIEAEELTEDKE